MSQQEIADMQAALERLSKALIADTSQEPSQPRCDTGSGGAGGSGGDAGPGGADNGGGTAPVSAAGQGGVQ